MYESIELRKACCAHPQARAAGAHAGRPQRLGHRPAPRAVGQPRRRAVQRARRQGPHQVQPAGRLELGRRVALHRRQRRALQPAARRSSCPASAARPARARSRSARTSAPAAGGGRTRRPRNAACMCKDEAAEVSMIGARDERPADRRATAARARPHPPRLARGRSHLHPARDRGRLRAPGPAVLRRQGLVRRAAPGREGLQEQAGRTARTRAACPSRCCTSTPATTSPR